MHGYTETFRLQANKFNLLKFTKFKKPKGQNGINWNALTILGEVYIFLFRERTPGGVEIYSRSLKLGQVFEKVQKHTADNSFATLPLFCIC